MKDEKNERGITRRPLLADAMFLLITVIVVYAVMASQRAVNETKRAESVRTAENVCISSTLFQTVDALNERTEFSSAQARANIVLQKSQLPLIQAIAAKDDGIGNKRGERIVSDYLDALTEYLTVSSQALSAGVGNPYPTLDSFLGCLKDARNIKSEDNQGS